MLSLSSLLYKSPIIEIIGDNTLIIDNIQFDSRKVTTNTLFIATKGTLTDGHQYINKAIELGAVAVVCEALPELIVPNITYVVVKDSHESLGQIASNYYDRPSEKVSVTAVTGTNGKTTVATLLFRLFRELGYSCGLLSTVQNQINDTVIPATHTTPDAIGLNELLAKMVQAGCTHVFMEASSHAIHQRRIAGLRIAGALFTNITHDHLDYHGTFENYIKAKKQLFDELPSSAFALVNIDDKRGRVMLQNTKAKQLTYSLQTVSNYKAKVLSNTIHGLELTINEQTLWCKLIGHFNAYNLLAVYGAAIELGENPAEILIALSKIEPVEGRFQKIYSKDGVIAIIDYAHTPDALVNVLDTINELREGNESIYTIIGCGGDRDTEKRPIMAEVACKRSNYVILTSDNPRSENPETIIDEMWKGVPISQKKKARSIVQRNLAIAQICAEAQSGDIILIAGKGHETYQEILGLKHPFSDKKEVIMAFTARL